MKNRILGNWSLALVLGLLPLAGGCSRATSAPLDDLSVSTNPLPPTASADLTTPALSSQTDAESPPPSTPAEEPAPAAVPNVNPSSSETPATPNVRTTGPFADLGKLANSGVSESVLLAFVTNSTTIFSLSPDEIIYLKDIGVSPLVISTVIQHDQVLRDAAAAAATPVIQTPDQQPAAPSDTLAAGSPVEVVLPAQDTSDSWTQPEEPVDPTFYDSLAPYGTWVTIDGYGACWQPAVVAANTGWQPYLDAGHWIYSDCGWYWLSDYSWGWAPFHYGRWFLHPSWGWCWQPDRVWGPSWVCWRYTDECCGWAPLPPGTRFVAGSGLMFRNHPVHSIAQFHLAAGSFPFVPWSHFNDHHLRPATLAPEHVNRVFNQTQVAFGFTGDRHTVVNQGPPTRLLTTATHRELKPVQIHEASFASVRSGRGELLTHDGQSVNVFRLTGSVPIRPQVQVGRSFGTQAAHSPSPITQSASVNSQLSYGANSSPEIRETQPARSSLIVIGRKDHTVIQTPQNTPSATYAGTEAPQYTSARQENAEAPAYQTAHPQNPNYSQNPRSAGSSFASQRQVRTETFGAAGQVPIQGQGRTVTVAQEAPAAPQHQFSAPHYEPPPRAVERVEIPQRGPEPVMESRPVRSEPAPPPSAPPPVAQPSSASSSGRR